MKIIRTNISVPNWMKEEKRLIMLSVSWGTQWMTNITDVDSQTALFNWHTVSHDQESHCERSPLQNSQWAFHSVSILGNFCPKITFHVKSRRCRLICHQNHHWHLQDKFEHVLKISQISLYFTFWKSIFLDIFCPTLWLLQVSFENL